MDKQDYHKYNYKKLFIIIYKMYRTLIRENITLVSIILFVIIFGTIQLMKPNLENIKNQRNKNAP